jgi:proton-translocating NADH-quinone oxidoreductase chain N
MEHFDIFQNHFKTLIPELFFISSTFVLLLYGVIYNPSAYYKFPILTKPIGWLAIQTLFITVLLLVNHQTEASSVILNNVLINDDFTLVIKTIILLSALSSILISLDYMGTKNQKINSFELILLILFSTLGMLFIISSYDLITMYLAIELQSLSFYVIAAFQRNNEFSTEAGLKYFILGALSSGILLFGESILYGFTGITNFEELCKLFTASKNPVNETFIADASYQLYPEWIDKIAPSSAAVLGLFFILIAFLFKIGAVPFHMWTPDVYEGAPTSVTAFFAITPKIAIIALMLRLTIYTFYDLIEAWQLIIVICAFLSMFVGTFGAINQNKIKRLFAYSSIAHVGYLLIALSTGTIESIESLLVYIIIYILMIINVFGILLVMAKEDFHVHQSVGIPNLSSADGKERIAYGKKKPLILTKLIFSKRWQVESFMFFL